MCSAAHVNSALHGLFKTVHLLLYCGYNIGV